MAAAKYSQNKLSSFTCELTILQAKNIEPPPKSDLFVRFYLSISENRSYTLNTKEIKPSSSTCSWNQTFSLECNGAEDSIAGLMQETSVVFELRQRTRKLTSLLGSSLSGKSKVVGRTEVPWRRVFEAPNMEFEGWMDFDGDDEGGKLLTPSICVGMKVSNNSRVSSKKSRRNGRLKKAGGNECRCKDCQDLHLHSCEDYYDVFAVAAVLEAF